MGPIKKRKKGEKKVDQNDLNDAIASASLRAQQPSQEPLDWWHDFSRRLSGPFAQSKKPVEFESVLKISRRTFDYICSLVKEDFLARSSNFTDVRGRHLSLNDQVAVALRRLSSGESLNTIGAIFGMHSSTVGQITWRFVESIEERGLHHIRWPSTEAEMKGVKSKFEKIRGFSNCCGAIDITHIAMTLPAVENDFWVDSEDNCSTILQAVVDPNMRFLDIITGWPGCLTDATVLRSSGLFKRCEEGKRLNGKNIGLSNGAQLREYIVGDAGFPLLPWLLTPYQGKGLSVFQIEFNKRHYATRLVARRALARLKEMWKIIHGVMWKPDKHRLPRIIFVCCLLHNIVIDLEDEVQDEMPLSSCHDPGYRQQFSDFVDQTALVMRDNLSLFLSGQSAS